MRFASLTSDAPETPFWIAWCNLLSALVLIALVILVAFHTLHESQRRKLEQQNAEIRAKDEKLQRQDKEMRKSFELLIRQRGALKKLDARLSEIAEKFKEQVRYDSSRYALQIVEKALFDANAVVLRENGKPFVKQFIRDYVVAVQDFFVVEGKKDEDNGIVDAIVLEGHGDLNGPQAREKNYVGSLNMTVKRATAVADFIFAECHFPFKNSFRRFLLVAGRANEEHILLLGAQNNEGLQWQKKRLWTVKNPGERNVSFRVIVGDHLLTATPPSQ